MTGNEFFCEALLQLAGNSTLALDVQNNKIGFAQWAQMLDRGASALLEVAAENNCLDDDKPP